MKHRHAALADFPVVLTLPLLWGDQDAFGHANNLVYLRWSESARVEYFSRVGLWPAQPTTDIGPILATISCDFKLPLVYPDTIEVGARVTEIGNSSIRMEHCIVSQQKDLIAATVQSTLVAVDYASNRPVPVPLKVREAIEQLEGRAVRRSRQTAG